MKQSPSLSLFYPITLEGRRGTTDEFATIPFHLDLFSAALVELAKSIPVHSLRSSPLNKNTKIETVYQRDLLVQISDAL